MAFTSLFNEYLASSACRAFRSIMFISLGLAAGIPFFYLQYVDTHGQSSPFDCVPWAIGGIFYIFGAALYALRIPKKLSIGTFDMIGQSHQIFHVCVLIGAALHFYASLNLFIERQNFTCPIEIPQ